LSLDYAHVFVGQNYNANIVAEGRKMSWSVRYKIVGLLTLGTMINDIDRVNISVAAPDIRRETGWDQA